MFLTWILCSAVAGAIAIASALVVYAIIHRKTRPQPKCMHCANLYYVMPNGVYECSEMYKRPISQAPVYCKEYIEREADG